MLSARYTESLPMPLTGSKPGSKPGSKTLLGFTLEELTDLALGSGQPVYRGRQLFDAIYRQRIERLSDVSTLPLDYRASLSEEGWDIGIPQIARSFVSSDGTIRYLIEMADGKTVETVWMPEGDGGEAGDGTDAGDEETGQLTDRKTVQATGASPTSEPSNAFVGQRTRQRATICVSSQVGCAVNCQFCFTALLGVERNLEAGEIIGQVIAVLRDRKVDPSLHRINLVFMGMGEPFLNYDNFIKAVRLLVAGVGISESRMTVSTAGIVPRIHEFGQEPVRPKLAISLNASNDTLRTQVMPLNRKWNLEMLLQAARSFPLRNRERLTFEYVLLGGVNDSPVHAREVAELVRGLRAKVNLIALNPGPELAYQTPVPDRVAAFQQILISAGIPAFVRRPRGRDILAACGQLKRTTDLVQVS
jgi:23S rRNA (adenine2503-C2)-methyltransferase